MHPPIAVLKRVPGEPSDSRAPVDEEESTLAPGHRGFRCATCDAEVASQRDVLSVSEEESVCAFVNPAGFLHEIVTLRAVVGLRLEGHSTAAHSWFDGYAWTIANCAACQTHLGWQFDALEPRSPSVFWGLRRIALTGT